MDEIHGVRVTDPYRWLEDGRSPEVQEWMKAQDTRTRAWLTKLPSLEPFRTRLTELLYVEVVSTPSGQGNRWFYTRRKPRQEKAVLYWREGEKGEDKVLIDPNLMSEDGSTSLGDWTPSQDGRYLAYTVKRNNADKATLYVREVATGKDLPLDVIADAKYSNPTWTPDSKGFYYNWLPDDPSIPLPELPGHTEFRYHALGTDSKSDRIIHRALGDPTRFLGGYLSRDGRWLFVEIQYGWTRNDVYVKDLKGANRAETSGGGKGSAPTAASTGSSAPAGDAIPRVGVSEPTLAAGFRPLIVGQDALYSVVPWKGAFYVKTNQGAPKYRIFKVDPSRLDRSQWKEIVPEGDAPIDGISVIGGRLVLTYLRRATNDVEIRTLDGAPARRVELPGLGTTKGTIGNPDRDVAFYDFASYTQPTQIHRVSVKSGKTTLWDAVKVPLDTSVLTVDQVFYPSKDGTRVSMFLVHRKDMQRNGENPTLLYGYGGFNVNMTPSFSNTFATWVDRGGVVAVPNLRGGGEYGEEWHRAGMLLKKQTVFDDFIAAAEYLVAEKITKPSRLGIYGGSNGGLLVGAAMVQRPELFGAVICSVPLIDMVRYHKSGAGPTWVEEYGSAEDPEQFKALYAYSPYHHVKEGTAYPAMLVMSADSDDRVDPSHARKFAAAIQHASSSDKPVFLWIERHAGHGGADLVKQQVEQSASMLAFLTDQLASRPD